MLAATLFIAVLLFVAQGIYRNYGKTKFDALPDHLGTAGDWKGTDNDTPLMRWDLLVKGWFAFGPRSNYSWARWKFPPKVLFATGGKGPWRFEPVAVEPNSNAYDFVLSRCQYYKRWAFVIEWPFSVRFHVYWRAADVPVEGSEWKNEFSIKKLFFVYGPIHWDADLVYWFLSFYIGGQWK